MGTNQRATGFTIIETMLFLAVTGLLAIGILAGTGGAINQQRYRDSVNSLQSFLQDQYGKVTNVMNDRDASWSCNSAAKAEQTAGEARGTGDCLLLGRLVTIQDDGMQIVATDVIGRRTSNVEKAATDILELGNYAIAESPIGREEQAVAWGAKVVKPGSTDAQPTRLLIIRSPLSGGIMTFTDMSATVAPGTMIANGVSKTALSLCVEPGGATVAGSVLGVRVSPFAAAASAVQVAPEGDNLCD